MENKTLLTGLVEEAALSVTAINESDISEVGNLIQTLEKIRESLGLTTGVSDEMVDKSCSLVDGSLENLKKISKEDSKDSNELIEFVSESLAQLVDLTETFNNPESTVIQIENETSAQNTQEEFIISEDDAPLVLDFITEAAEHLENSEAALLELEAEPDNKDKINTIFRGFHTIKGMAGFLNLTDIGSLAHSAENLLDLARKDELSLMGSNTDVIFSSMDMMKRMLSDLKEAMENASPVKSQPDLSVLLDTLEACASGKEIKSADVAASRASTEEKEVKDKTDSCTEKKPSNAKSSINEEKIKVSTSRLDNLINMVGELVIAQLMVSEEVCNNFEGEHELGRKISHQSKIVRELQELSVSMRMVPVEGVFQRMARMVRDLSHKSGKTVSFNTVGGETELDRSIVEKIADPLIHMIRNSVDHGIESPQDRKKAGKSETGHVILRAFHRAGNVFIEIQDDGKGLDKESILKKAIERGVVEEGQELSDEEIFKLIFHAGLSTAQKITSISGRGVGMDVVKKNIEALHGKIDISSKAGEGTTFTIKLPLTLAIIDGQIVTVGCERYIIPINSIVESIRPRSEQISTVQKKFEMVMVRGELIPLVRLHKLFNVDALHEDPTKSLLVIVQEENKKCCVLVDELLGQQQVVIKNLGAGLGKLKGVSGGAIMGDGKVSLILDVPGLIELSQE